MKTTLSLSLLATLLTGCLATGPRNIQTLSTFHRPESVAFSLDGKTLFVSNCGSDVFGPEQNFVGFVEGNGAISKLTIDENGHATVSRLRLIENLNAPVGIAILPKATGKYPKGTLLVNQGIALLVDREGRPVTDIQKLGTGILFFNPDTGEQLGKIGLGPGSRVAELVGHPALLPNSIAFDSAGNLYVTDTAKGGDRLMPTADPHPGLIRIEHGSIDAVSDGAPAASTPAVSFTPIAGLPNGVGYWTALKAICVVTMGGTSPEGTAIYVIPESSFPRKDLPPPLRDDVGTADGIAFTPARTIITSRFAGDLLAVPVSGEPFPLNVDPFAAPADHRLWVLEDGSSILAVPDQNRKDPRPWAQDVRIIRLPPGF